MGDLHDALHPPSPVPGSAAPFVDAVAANARRASPAYHAMEREAVERRVWAMLALATRGEEDELAAVLADDAPLFAAFFQNVDLLFDGGSPEAGAVGAAVMQAVEIVSARPGE